MSVLLKCTIKKKATVNTIAFFAPPQGLEPWTYGLTVRRSNQLSYGGKIYMCIFSICDKTFYLLL